MNYILRIAQFLKTLPWWVGGVYGAVMGFCLSFLIQKNLMESVQESLFYKVWFVINMTIACLLLLRYFCECRNITEQKFITPGLVFLTISSFIFGLTLAAYSLYRALIG